MQTNTLHPETPSMQAAADNHVFVDTLAVDDRNPRAPMAQLETLLERARKMADQKADILEPAKGLTFDQDFRLVIPSPMPMAPLMVDDNAISQLYAKLVSPVYGKGSTKSTLPGDFMEALEPDLRAGIVNRNLGKLDSDLFIRTYQGRARAILSSGYTAIDNLELLEIVKGAVEQRPTGDMHLVRPYLDANDLNLRICYKDIGGIDPETGNPRWGIGTVISNGEIGNRSIKIWPFVQRGSCTNTTIFNVESAVHMQHRGNRGSKIQAILYALATGFELAAEGLERLEKAYGEPVPDFEDVLNGLARKYGWTDEVATAVAVGTRGSHSRGGIVDGVTEAAWKKFTGNEQTTMERLGGELLMAPMSLFGKAAAEYHDHQRREQAMAEIAALPPQQRQAARRGGWRHH